MKNYINTILLFFTVTTILQSQNTPDSKNNIMNEKKIIKTDKEWEAILSEEEFRVLRNKGTEYPHTGKYNLHFENGVYNCNGCKSPLFNSDQKFESD